MGWLINADGDHASTCTHGRDFFAHPVSLLRGAWNCPDCNRVRAEEEQRESDRIEALRSDYSEEVDAAEKALAISPPSEVEIDRYIAAKQREAAAYIDETDPEWPTGKKIKACLPFAGVWAKNFCDNVRIDETD